MKIHMKRVCIFNKSISSKIRFKKDMLDVNTPFTVQELLNEKDELRILINGYKGASNQLGFA